MESVQLRAEIDLKSIYGLKSATPFKIHLTEQWALINVSFQRFFCLYGFSLSLSLSSEIHGSFNFYPHDHWTDITTTMMLRQPLHPSHESMVFRPWLGFVESEMSERAQSQKKKTQPWPTSPCTHITAIDRSYDRNHLEYLVRKVWYQLTSLQWWCSNKLSTPVVNQWVFFLGMFSFPSSSPFFNWIFPPSLLYISSNCRVKTVIGVWVSLIWICLYFVLF